MFLHLLKMREQREALRHSNKKLESTAFTVLYCISLICIHCISKQYLSKKRLQLHHSVRMETVWVWLWEGLFICTKWHMVLFDPKEVNSNHCPWRHKPSFLLKVLQSQALRHCTQPHRDCSVQQALNRQDGSLQTPNPLPLVPSEPIFCSKPHGKSCQTPLQSKIAFGDCAASGNCVRQVTRPQRWQSSSPCLCLWNSPFQSLSPRAHWGNPCAVRTAANTHNKNQKKGHFGYICC